MNQCKDCIYWAPDTFEEESPKWGLCHGWLPFTSKFSVLSDEENADLETREDFGCASWEDNAEWESGDDY